MQKLPSFPDVILNTWCVINGKAPTLIPEVANTQRQFILLRFEKLFII